MANKLFQIWQDLPLGVKGLILNALPLTVLLASLGSLYYKEQQAAFLEDKLRNKLQMQRDIQAVHTQLVEASTAVRDYLLTGNKGFLNIYLSANQKLPEILLKLEQKLEDPEQQAHIQNITPLVKENLADLKILAEKNISQEKLQDEELINKFDSQSKTLNALREEIEAMGTREAILVAQEQAKVNDERQNNLHFTMIAALIGILGSLVGAWIFSNTIVQRVRQIRDSAAHLARGEPLALPSISRDELGQLTKELDHASQLLAKSMGEAHSARIEAEEANHAKSSFLSRTSHELRTPLNAILGFAQILENDLPEGRQKNSASLISGAGKHLLKLINEVLDIARIESGDMKMHVSAFNLANLLDETTNYIRPLGKIRDIDIKTHYAEDLAIGCDRQKLMQVILNLLSNALKYGPENSVVHLRAYSASEKLVIEVEDSGLGIPLSRRAGLFTPFNRLGAEKTKTEGTGLGLALSKQIMDAMGGSLEVAEHKSLFIAKLPMQNALVEFIQIESIQIDSRQIDAMQTESMQVEKSTIQENAQEKAAVPVLAKSYTFQNQKILYVEDNASNRALIEAIIKRHAPLKLYFANTLKDGLNFLTDIQPDLVLIDLHLPDGSGETLIEFMKQNAPYQQTPIFVLSADAMPATIARLKHMQINEYFTKPLDIAHFNQQLQQHLAHTS